MRLVHLCGLALMGLGLLLLAVAVCVCATVTPKPHLADVKELQVRTDKGVLEVKAPITKDGDPILCSCHVQQARGGAQLFCDCERLY